MKVRTSVVTCITQCTLSDCSYEPLSRLVTSVAPLGQLLREYVPPLLPSSGLYRYYIVKYRLWWSSVSFSDAAKTWKTGYSKDFNLCWTASWSSWRSVCHPAGGDRMHEITKGPQFTLLLNKVMCTIGMSSYLASLFIKGFLNPHLILWGGGSCHKLFSGTNTPNKHEQTLFFSCYWLMYSMWTRPLNSPGGSQRSR